MLLCLYPTLLVHWHLGFFSQPFIYVSNRHSCINQLYILYSNLVNRVRTNNDYLPRACSFPSTELLSPCAYYPWLNNEVILRKGIGMSSRKYGGYYHHRHHDHDHDQHHYHPHHQQQWTSSSLCDQVTDCSVTYAASVLHTQIAPQVLGRGIILIDCFLLNS